jgi:hypothetical protein
MRSAAASSSTGSGGRAALGAVLALLLAGSHVQVRGAAMALD